MLDPAPADIETISVVLPVHRGVAVEHLRLALDSVFAQTLPATQVVVVEDGPLDAAHLALLSMLELQHPCIVRVVLATNQGAGVANQAGLEAATGRWIAKADADDVNVAHRFAVQLAYCRENGLDLCGAAMREFEGDLDGEWSVRIPPLTAGAIAARMRSNNPFNHPTVFFRRTAARDAGGYPPMRFMQDYVLFARMAAAGARMGNLAEPLVHFRAGVEMHRRRADPRMTRLEFALQRELRRLGTVGPVRSRVNLAGRLFYRRLPARARGLVLRWTLTSGRGRKR